MSKRSIDSDPVEHTHCYVRSALPDPARLVIGVPGHTYRAHYFDYDGGYLGSEVLIGRSGAASVITQYIDPDPPECTVTAQTCGCRECIARRKD